MKPWSLTSTPPPEKLSVGCRTLDDFLGGGIPTGQITEIVSESSCGKTQLSLQLSLSSSLPSLYLHSDFPFPLKRLVTLSLRIPASSLDSLFLRPLLSPHHLLDVLLQLEKTFQNSVDSETQFPFRLIVIDSVAALFRSEFDNTGADLKKRASLFFAVSSKLREIATRFGLAVVVTNQVVDVMTGSSDDGLRVGNYRRLFSSGREVGPALGLSWASCVNSRLFLSRDEVAVTEEGGLVRFVTRREIRVVFSPYLPASSCEFVITRDGVFGVGCKDVVLKKTPSLDLNV